MSKIIIFNKPYGVICQFSSSPPHPTLKEYIHLAGVYPAGRLDTDSEGLLILTNDGKLQSLISEPKHKKFKTYWVQVDGIPNELQLDQLRRGVDLGDFVSAIAKVKLIDEPFDLWERIPPIRVRKNLPTSWLEISICEGKNRQVRRMTAKVGLPTLRLIRAKIGNVTMCDLKPGQWQEISYAEFIQKLN